MFTPYRMTPKRRFLSGLLGGRVDRPPIGAITSVTNIEQMEICEAAFPDAHLDGARMASLAAGAHTVLGYDAIMPYFSVAAEAAALGCQVDWGDRENMPAVLTSPWEDPRQVLIPEDFLERAPVRAVLEAIRILRARHGHRVAIVGKVMGPWTLAYHLHGVQPFLMETLTDPPRVRQFIERLKEITVLFGRAQIAAGADALCIADHATGDLISARMYRQYLWPVHQELTRRLGCPTALHICGNTADRLEAIATSGFDCYHFESRVDAASAVERVAGRISLMGNVNNPEVLLRGTPDQVEASARAAWEAGVRIIGPECAVPLNTPTENLRAIARIAQPMG
ncbi:MAG: MtaA/CmuA family methyltransferase [Anaerolineae bacterium]|jgi:MtaA/CmuA family methyltransferase|nr:MtaA/CmuA family methyltransferase [Chloroflexota bacterium]